MNDRMALMGDVQIASELRLTAAEFQGLSRVPDKRMVCQPRTTRAPGAPTKATSPISWLYRHQRTGLPAPFTRAHVLAWAALIQG